MQNNPGQETSEKIKETLEEIKTRLKPTRMNARLFFELGNRTPRQIIKSGKISSALGCLDQAVVIGSLLKQKGLETWVVAEQVVYNNRRALIHFTVQATDGKKQFTIDPRPDKINVIAGWPTERSGELIQKQTIATFRQLFKKQITGESMDLSAFKITGIKNKFDYTMRSKPTAIKTLLSKLTANKRKNRRK